MKRFKIFIAILLLSFFCFTVPAHAALQDMWATVYKWEGGIGADGKLILSQITSGIQFQILKHGDTAAETLYYYGGSTALTNTPVSTTSFESAAICNKLVAFSVDPTEGNDRYVDVIVNDTAGGYTLFYKNFDKYTHTLVIDERPNVLHAGMVYFNGATTTATSTGVYFLRDTFIQDLRVEVVGTSSAQTLDVGLTEVDTDGFRIGVLLTTAGFVADTAVVTASGVKYTYYPASTYGSMLKTAITGTSSTYHGGVTPTGYSVTSSITVGNTLMYNNSGATAYGYLHYFFITKR